jgi:hypothetical protein
MHVWKKSHYWTDDFYTTRNANMLDSVDCSLSWEGHNSLIFQRIRRLVYTVKIHEHVRKTRSLDPIWSHKCSHLCLFLQYILSLQVFRIKLWVICSSNISRLTCSVHLIFSNYIILLVLSLRAFSVFKAPHKFVLPVCAQVRKERRKTSTGATSMFLLGGLLCLSLVAQHSVSLELVGLAAKRVSF